jgi:hypothetical protein
MQFDVILPTIDRGSLFAAINSVCQQTHQEWTLWIVQDGILVSDLLTQAFPDPRVRFIHKERTVDDSGASARNLGIQYGNAAWIAYLDDDDIFLPNHLQMFSELGRLHPEANMLRTIGQSFSWRHKSPRSSKLVRKLGPVNSQDILTVGMAHTREIFNKTSGWQPVDNHDHLLWREMLAAGGVPAIAHEVTFEFER